jgi:hypothetical protein
VATLAGVARPEGPTRRRHGGSTNPAKQERSDEKGGEADREGVSSWGSQGGDGEEEEVLVSRGKDDRI